MNRRLHLEYLFKDRPYDPNVSPADYDMLCAESGGARIYGEILWPDGGFAEPRPCVLLSHGYPGVARNDDLAFALRRIGCVVVVLHHRGAWGSEGQYLVSHCVEDVIRVYEQIRTPAFCQQYYVDPNAIFLAGHSMGGNSVLQAARRLQGVRGLILLAPYDPTWHLRSGHPEALRPLLQTGYILHSDGLEAIFRDIEAHVTEYAFDAAFQDLRDQNLCCILGTLDRITLPEMILPLWQTLRPRDFSAIQHLVQLPAAHGLCGCRTAVIQTAAQFVAMVCGEVPLA